MVLQLALWTAGIVVLTLLVNAPLMPYLLKWTNLSNASPIKVRAALSSLFCQGTAGNGTPV